MFEGDPTLATVVSSTVITLDSTPDLGQLDRRANAYVGSVIRVLSSSRVFQERVISAFDATTNRATVRVAFWRVPAAVVPRDRAARSRWLYDEWSRVDARARLDAMARAA